MFSRSRKTAMVASEVAVGIARFYPHEASRMDLKPVVIEADAYPLRVGDMGRDFVAQPTLEQHHLSRLRGKGDPGAVGHACLDLAWRCCHEAIEPGILEFNARTAGRDLHVVGA